MSARRVLVTRTETPSQDTADTTVASGCGSGFEILFQVGSIGQRSKTAFERESGLVRPESGVRGGPKLAMARGFGILFQEGFRLCVGRWGLARGRTGSVSCMRRSGPGRAGTGLTSRTCACCGYRVGRPRVQSAAGDEHTEQCLDGCCMVHHHHNAPAPAAR